MKKQNNFLHKTKTRIIGVGGGGSSIVSEIADKISKADFLVLNTDSRALKAVSKNIKKVQFGSKLTNGLGTGMNPDLAEAAAQEEKDKFKKVLENQDLIIIISCLGAGTGSGATPVLAKMAKSMGIMTYGVFTLPFEFEGKKKMDIALAALEKIKDNFNAYTVIPNERIFKVIDKKTPLKESFSLINKKLAENLKGLIEAIYLPGLINIDFADLKTILQAQGKLTFLNYLEIEKNNLEEGVKKVLTSPFCSYDISGAKGILYNITGSNDLQLDEVSGVSNLIRDLANKKAKIIFGISNNPKCKNKIGITLLATGCGEKEEEEKKPTVKKKVKKKIKPQKTRKNALEIKKTTDEEEEKIRQEEDIWETPAILRKNNNE